MEADDLSVLHKSLFEDKLSATDLFLQKLRSDTSIKSALQRFYSILKRGVSLIDDDANNSECKLGFQLWTDSQIQSVVSLGIAIVSSSRSLSGCLFYSISTFIY
jgi:E3 ubiquitin-protein ligase UBR4